MMSMVKLASINLDTIMNRVLIVDTLGLVADGRSFVRMMSDNAQQRSSIAFDKSRHLDESRGLVVVDRRHFCC